MTKEVTYLCDRCGGTVAEDGFSVVVHKPGHPPGHIVNVLEDMPKTGDFCSVGCAHDWLALNA